MFPCLAAVAVLWLAGPAFAHHSNTPFDMSQTLRAAGVVLQVSFKNPHSSLTLRTGAQDEHGAVTFEGHSLATLRHYGLLPATVEAGDTITISYAPRRDGQPGGIFLSVTTEDGVTLDFSKLGYD